MENQDGVYPKIIISVTPFAVHRNERKQIIEVDNSVVSELMIHFARIYPYTPNPTTQIKSLST